MTLEKIYNKYLQHHQKWIVLLEWYDEKTLTQQPSAGEWSMAQVVDHVCRVTDKCLLQARMCKTQGETGHSGFGAAVFSLMGSFPPIKLKIRKIPPGLEDIYQPKQVTKEEAVLLLEQSLKNMQHTIAVIADVPKNKRMAHWAGGWFNAKQWYHCAEMHLKHHFRQEKRINKVVQAKG